MIVTLIFMDEAGDTGFKFDLGSSEYFVIVMVIFDHPIEAERLSAAIDALREELALPRTFEFHFSAGAKPRIREAFFQALRPFSFRYRGLVINKREYLKRHGPDAEDKLFETVVVELFQHGTEIQDAALYMDRITGGEFERRVNVYLRQKMRANGKRPVRKFKHVDSRENSLIQVADMICGATLRAYARQDHTFRKMIQNKEEFIIEK